jgi:hypothetical protein
MMNSRSFMLSALIAGVVIGFLGNLPLLNLINCALCIWVWLGGALSVYLYRRWQPGDPPLTGSQGAALGAVSGLIGALVGAVVFFFTAALSVPMMDDMMRSLQVQGDMPWRQGSGIGMAFAGAFFFLVVDAVLYPIFGALGGLLATNVRQEPRPVAPAYPTVPVAPPPQPTLPTTPTELPPTSWELPPTQPTQPDMPSAPPESPPTPLEWPSQPSDQPPAPPIEPPTS